ncbi:hypothetical protein Tco_1246816 [Tanacetum coccineum]
MGFTAMTDVIGCMSISSLRPSYSRWEEAVTCVYPIVTGMYVWSLSPSWNIRIDKDYIMEYLVRSYFKDLLILETNTQYSIKMIRLYQACTHKDQKENKIKTPYPEASIRRIAKIADPSDIFTFVNSSVRNFVITSRVKVPAGRYVVPTGRVKVPAGRYVVPTGKDNVIVSAGRTKVIPAGSTILVLVVLCLLRVDSKVS